MKRAKDYSHVVTVNYRPEMDACLMCSGKLKRSHRLWNKYIIRLCGTIYAVSFGYRCSNENCCSNLIYRSAEAESLSLKYYSFGLDVIARIGELRFLSNMTLGEIHLELQKRVEISEREIQYLIETYMLLVTSLKQDKSYLDEVISPEGIVLSIDGIQPEKGNEVLYILRDVLSGNVLTAENLLSSDCESIKSLIQPVIDLGYPILGVISDGQKSIRNAITSLLPNVPYQLCHYHYLDDISKGLEERDRKLKTNLKKGIRNIRTVEKRLQRMEDNPNKDALADLTQAVRTAALTRSVYPFECGGIKIYDKLLSLENAITTCQKSKNHPLLVRLLEIVTGYKPYQQETKEVMMFKDIVTRMATLIDPENFSNESEEKRKQRLYGYLGYLTKMKLKFPQLASDFDDIIKITKSFLPCLFAYLRCHKLPATNNDLEIFHRKVKTMHRRRTGRKSSHDYIIRYGLFAVYQMGGDCSNRIKQLAYAKLKVLKQKLKEINKRYSKMYKMKHKTDQFLSEIVHRWNNTNEPKRVPT
jgi:hypothetical protein